MLYTEQLHSVLFAYKFWLQNKAYWLCLYRRRRVKRQAVTLACEKLGERLFEARDRAGLTLRELGQRSGVSWSSISAIEKGRQSATVETIERLALAPRGWRLGKDVGGQLVTSGRSQMECIQTPSEEPLRLVREQLIEAEPTLQRRGRRGTRQAKSTSRR